MKDGLTLIELIIAIMMMSLLIGATIYVFYAVLLSWSSQETRSGVDIDIDYDIEKVVRDLREAKLASLSDPYSSYKDEIRFSNDKANFYTYYLYNAGDHYPPTFGQSSYQLKKAMLTGGLDGTFTYGSGDLIMSDIKPRTAFMPERPVILSTGNMVTIDISIKRRDEEVRSRTAVRLRNYEAL